MIGFEDSVNVAEETKRPSRTFPRALFIGIAIAGTLYLLVTPAVGVALWVVNRLVAGPAEEVEVERLRG